MKCVVALGLLLLVAMATASTIAELPELQPGEKCTPGVPFRIKCNRCSCGPNGEASCTKKGCIQLKKPTTESVDVQGVVEEKHVEKRDVALGNRCEPGSLYKHNNCNTCRCPASGDRRSAACTRLACVTI